MSSSKIWSRRPLCDAIFLQKIFCGLCLDKKLTYLMLQPYMVKLFFKKKKEKKILCLKLKSTLLFVELSLANIKYD